MTDPNQPMSTEEGINLIRTSLSNAWVEIEKIKAQIGLSTSAQPIAQVSGAEWEAELKTIKGLGKKTIEDIMTVYPSKDRLLDAIKLNMHLPFNDNVEKKLVEKYK